MTDYVALCQAMVESVFGEDALDDDYIVYLLFAPVFPKLQTTKSWHFCQFIIVTHKFVLKCSNCFYLKYVFFSIGNI